MAMVKFLMLLPITYNDGSEVPEAVRRRIFDRIYEYAGGYTITGEATGAYRMKSGEKQIDRSVQVWIGVNESEIDGLVSLVSEFCELLNQESMYLERTFGKIDFISPPGEGGQS